jgi:hypothetical protein
MNSQFHIQEKKFYADLQKGPAMRGKVGFSLPRATLIMKNSYTPLQLGATLQRRGKMDRRTFLQSAVASFFVVGFAGTAGAAERHAPAKVDQALFGGINRVKDPGGETPLEK